MPPEIDIAVDGHAAVGESPVWDSRRRCLWWVDIRRGEVHRFDGRVDTVAAREPDQPVAAVALRDSAGLLIATGQQLAARRPDGTTEWSLLCPAGDRLNDGKCDPAGRMVIGTLNHDPARWDSALYSITAGPPPAVRPILAGLRVSNGLGWSPDGRLLYFIDTATRRVDVLDYDLDSGAVAGRRVLIDLADRAGNPDGLTLDADGHLWVAMSGGGAVLRVSPAGEVVRTLSLPVSRVTSCTFGGAHLTELYMTSASHGLNEEQRRRQVHAGAVFVVDLGIPGVPAPTFAER